MHSQPEQIDSIIKISDGLYIGDQQSPQDEQFLVLNHVTHIINASNQKKQVLFQDEIRYLDVETAEDAEEGLVNINISQIFSFINKSKDSGSSVLIHTKESHSRTFTIVALYFMQKFHWSLFKCLEYLNSKVRCIEIKTAYFNFLKEFQHQLLISNHMLSYNWEQKPLHNAEELLIRNTFINGVNKIIKKQVKTYGEESPYSKKIIKKVKFQFENIHSNYRAKSMKSIPKNRDEEEGQNSHRKIIVSVKKILEEHKKIKVKQEQRTNKGLMKGLEEKDLRSFLTKQKSAYNFLEIRSNNQNITQFNLETKPTQNQEEKKNILFLKQPQKIVINEPILFVQNNDQNNRFRENIMKKLMHSQSTFLCNKPLEVKNTLDVAKIRKQSKNENNLMKSRNQCRKDSREGSLKCKTETNSCQKQKQNIHCSSNFSIALRREPSSKKKL